MLLGTFRIILALLLLAAPALTLAQQVWQAEEPACAAPAAPSGCHSQAAAQSGCGCCQGGTCHMEAAPPAAGDEFLTGQAGRVDPPAPGRQVAAGRDLAWSPAALAPGQAPWRPPKPLYLRCSSLLI